MSAEEADQRWRFLQSTYCVGTAWVTNSKQIIFTPRNHEMFNLHTWVDNPWTNQPYLSQNTKIPLNMNQGSSSIINLWQVRRLTELCWVRGKKGKIETFETKDVFRYY